MYQKLLIAIDGSEITELILQRALGLAKALQSQVRIVHVADVLGLRLNFYSHFPAPFPYLEDLKEHLLEGAKNILHDAEEKARQAGVKAETKLITLQEAGQHISDLLAKEAEKWPADLMVMGTHGHRGFVRFLLGSVAEKLLRISTVPILLIREK
jgi:nucleotide-binding universal stress UspA family protein